MIMRNHARSLVTALAGALLALATFAASAQSFPSKLVEFVVHVNPGGGTDVFARLVMEIIDWPQECDPFEKIAGDLLREQGYPLHEVQ